MLKRIAFTLVVVSNIAVGCSAEQAKKSAPKAETPKESTVSDSDLKPALDEFAKGFVNAFNHRDAKATAAHWAPTAVHVDHATGKRSTGRDEIEQMYVDHFKGDVAEMVLVLDEVRQIKPGVAKVEGSVRIIEPETSETSESRISAVFVKENGKWLLDSVNENTVAPSPESISHLQPLEWLVGEWRDQDGDVQIHNVCKWAIGRNFLTRSFTVTLGNDVTHQGTQIIGWDPESNTIHSWSFESDGGYGEGVWTHDGEKWTVAMRGLTPEGRRASAKQVITQIDDDSYTTQLISRDIDGEMLPTGNVIKVKRIQTTK